MISDYENDSELEDLKEYLGPKTPVFNTPKEDYSAVEVLKILLGETPVSKLCTMKPRSVRICASFVIDRARHVSLRDIHAMIMALGLPLHLNALILL